MYAYTVPTTDGGNASNGNLLARSDPVMGDWALQYDTLNRLTEAAGNAQGLTVNGAPYNNECWTYDPFGNRLQEAVQSPNCIAQTPGRLNYITNVTMSASNNNRIASASGSGYIADANLALWKNLSLNRTMALPFYLALPALSLRVARSDLFA